MASLAGKLIRLAHDDKDLRSPILGLLKSAGVENPWHLFSEDEKFDDATKAVTKAVEEAKAYLKEAFKGGSPLDAANKKFLWPVQKKYKDVGATDTEPVEAMMVALRDYAVNELGRPEYKNWGK